MTSARLIWAEDGRDWPTRAHSRFVRAGGLRWHVQVMGAGPPMLLLHGTGAATHSWRGLAPLLARDFTVVAPDLPGHGFTGPPATSAGFSLPGAARGLGALLKALDIEPVLAAGHSAGAAIAARMCLDEAMDPMALLSLNGAFLPFPGVANDVFNPLARMLSGSTAIARALTLFTGSTAGVARLIASTGSRIDPEGQRFYARLTGNPAHVSGALSLMANWDLRPLLRDLPHLRPRLVLVTGDRDRMVPPADAARVQRLVPTAEIVSLLGLGHLAHEERPGDIAALSRRVAEQTQVPGTAGG